MSQAKTDWGGQQEKFDSNEEEEKNYGGKKTKLIVEYFEKLPKTKTTENTFIVGEHKHKENKTQESIEANERENMIGQNSTLELIPNFAS